MVQVQAQNRKIYLAGGSVAVLGVLLILRVEIVNGVRHDVPRVHRLPAEMRVKLSHQIRFINLRTVYLSEEEMLCIVTVLPTFSPKLNLLSSGT